MESIQYTGSKRNTQHITLNFISSACEHPLQICCSWIWFTQWISAVPLRDASVSLFRHASAERVLHALMYHFHFASARIFDAFSLVTSMQSARYRCVRSHPLCRRGFSYNVLRTYLYVHHAVCIRQFGSNATLGRMHDGGLHTRVTHTLRSFSQFRYTSNKLFHKNDNDFKCEPNKSTTPFRFFDARTNFWYGIYSIVIPTWHLAW